jgi:hypothetical protein
MVFSVVNQSYFYTVCSLAGILLQERLLYITKKLQKMVSE